MKYPLSRILSIGFALSAVLPISAQTIFHVDFEAPTYALGSVHGQDNWDAQYAFSQVVNTTVHGGSQSLNIGPGGGYRPYEVAPYELNASVYNSFWLETWVYVPSGPGYLHNFAAGNGIANAFNFGIYDNGVVDFNLGSYYGELRNVGSSILDKWLRMRVEHLAYTFELTMTLVGDGVNETAIVGYYTPAAAQSFLSVHSSGAAGMAYWDDITAGHGVIPEPSAFALALLSAGLVSFRRRLESNK
jgi:hypothetical protein